MIIKRIKYFSYYDNHNNKYTKFYAYQKQFIFNILRIYDIHNISCRHLFEYPIPTNDFDLDRLIASENEEDDNDTLYILNSIDYYYLTVNITATNINTLNKFLKTKNYIFFHFEVYLNDNLEQIGYLKYNHNLISNGLIGDDRKNFIRNLYKNAKHIILQSYRNIEHLKQNYDCKNIIYFPCLGYSKINKFAELQQKNREIDLLFYGTRDKNTPHRNNMIEKLIKYTDQNNINFVYDKFLYGDDKDNMLSKSKIVLHLPIKLESKIAPAWCKIMELMCKKIFFIMEENDEIYKSGLQDIVVFYKHNDFTDLTKQIDYYLVDEEASDRRNKVIESCHELVKTKYNMDEFIQKLIN